MGGGAAAGAGVLSSSSFISYVSLKVISHERAIRAEITAQVDSTTAAYPLSETSWRGS